MIILLKLIRGGGSRGVNPAADLSGIERRVYILCGVCWKWTEKSNEKRKEHNDEEENAEY